MRKLLYTVVLSCTSMLLLPHEAMAVGPTYEYKDPDLDIDYLPPTTGPELEQLPTIDKDIGSIGGIGNIGGIIGGTDNTDTPIVSKPFVPTTPDDDQIYGGEGDYSCKNISCADMGYSQQSVANCTSYVNCPFDVSYKACVVYSEDPVLDSCPANAICENKYEVTGCESGYIKEPLTGSCIKDLISCTPNDCSGYDLTSIPENASYDTCTPGCGDTKPRYKVISCNSGYVTSVSSCGRNPTDGSWTLTGSGTCKKCTVSCNSGYTNSGGSCLPSNICETRAKELGIPNYPMGQGTGGNKANFFSTMSCPCSGSSNYCSVNSTSHCVNLTTTYGSKTYNCSLMLPSGANNGQCKGYNSMMATSVHTLEELANRLSSTNVTYISMEAGTISSTSGYGTGRLCLETSW